MNARYDIYIGRIDGWHTFRKEQAATYDVVCKWVLKGYRIQTQQQIGTFLNEVYLVKI